MNEKLSHKHRHHRHKCHRHGRLAQLTWLLAVVVLLIWVLHTFACTSAGRARHFNKSAAAPESRANEILTRLEVAPGSAVADLGTGGGYFAYLFADTE